jgi:long-chain acyl-CoA synthetase
MIMIRGESASQLTRALFHFFLNKAWKIGAQIVKKRPFRFIDQVLYRIVRWCIYKPLMDNLGFSRIRVAYTTGGEIGPDVFDFYRSIGMNLKQAYGLTETSVFVTVHKEGERGKANTVGTPIKDVEVRVAENGEVLYRGPGSFHSYFRNPEETRAFKDMEGFLHTGDIGQFDVDGQLSIIGKSNELCRLNDKTLFSPKYIENKLKYSYYVKEAVVLGHNRDYFCAIISIDPPVVSNWAQQRNLLFVDYSDLAGKAEVYDLIAECVEIVNHELSKDLSQRRIQIKRFVILPKEFNAVEGEVTHTGKVRRQFIEEKYTALIDALFSGMNCYHFDTQMKFEDGQARMVGAELRIREVQTFAGVDTVSSSTKSPQEV